ncbi:pyridoxamine 5'-phosphate oxidase family protein [Dietzia sp. E1]|uniref:pyridoxamine 5'-phosphate oxidase family protein n=1 Tax=Dietzia sp. E1 TaxID=328361 RepID=UPI0015F9278B|nr:pyridoxamine 5'-phosphate oxidase family protein [Dietzia sp. E1]MBB1022739.1 pyridoxamine 5'-phosphate oxidase family protein [Dietzia sp. E1]
MDDSPITDFEEVRCLQLLASESLGRLVTVTGGRAEIFPVNYAMSRDGKIFFRTAEGSKLAGLTVHPEVLFEVDHVEGRHAWSVVVRGRARSLESFDEINRAEELDLKPWIPTLKYNFVEITPEQLTGLGFEFGEEPERYQG